MTNTILIAKQTFQLEYVVGVHSPLIISLGSKAITGIFKEMIKQDQSAVTHLTSHNFKFAKTIMSQLTSLTFTL